MHISSPAVDPKIQKEYSKIDTRMITKEYFKRIQNNISNQNYQAKNCYKNIERSGHVAHIVTSRHKQLILKFQKNTVFPRIVSAETILF